MNLCGEWLQGVWRVGSQPIRLQAQLLQLRQMGTPKAERMFDKIPELDQPIWPVAELPGIE